MSTQKQFKSEKGIFRLLLIFVLLVTIVCIGVIHQSISRTLLLVEHKTTYLCPYFRGGLGNLMFMYASLYGIAKANNMTLLIDTKDEIGSVFPNLDVTKMQESSKICDKAKVVFERRPCAYDIETVNVNRSINIKHRSYLQSWKYFEKHEQSIRSQFQFRNDTQKQAQNVINNIVNEYVKSVNDSSNLQIIGVHVRRGDYLTAHNRKYGYITANKEYLDKAFQYFRKKLKNCLFIVFMSLSTDGLKWREKNIQGEDIVFAPTSKREVDMCALTKCNHTILTVGSFGWWSAWLGNGRTVYFKDVARVNSSLRTAFSEDMRDFFPPKWIGLS